MQRRQSSLNPQAATAPLNLDGLIVAERRSSLRPALAVSGSLHLLVLLALLVSWRLAPPLTKPLQVVAVNVISDAQATNVRAAAQGPRRQTAAEPEPTPPAPEPPAPVEAPEPPKPTPPPAPASRPRSQPQPKPLRTPPPKPIPKPETRPKPTPTPPKPAPDLDLDSLSKSVKPSASKPLDLSSIAKSHSSGQALDLTALAAVSGGRRASAARGSARPSTDYTAHAAVGAGTALDASSLSALQAKLYRYWHLNCDVEGATGVIVKVRIRLGPNNGLVGTPTVLSQSSSGADGGVVEASAQRAKTAVAEAAPFTELPKNAPKDIVLKFNAKEACSG